MLFCCCCFYILDVPRVSPIPSEAGRFDYLMPHMITRFGNPGLQPRWGGKGSPATGRVSAGCHTPVSFSGGLFGFVRNITKQILALDSFGRRRLKRSGATTGGVPKGIPWCVPIYLSCPASGEDGKALPAPSPGPAVLAGRAVPSRGAPRSRGGTRLLRQRLGGLSEPPPPPPGPDRSGGERPST